MKRVPKLLSFGRGGHTVEYTRNMTESGYDSPQSFDYSRLPSGTPVLDKLPAIDTPEGFQWVFKGPMVDADLQDDQIDRCPTPSPMLAAGVSGGFQTLLALQEAHTDDSAGPLDSVSVSVYIAGWKRVGARVGVVDDGSVVWE